MEYKKCVLPDLSHTKAAFPQEKLSCVNIHLLLILFFSSNTLGDGNVSFEEFVDILSNMAYEDKSGLSSADQEERELRDAFRVFDKHNRGYITASDLRAVLQCLGEDLDEEESKYKKTFVMKKFIIKK